MALPSMYASILFHRNGMWDASEGALFFGTNLRHERGDGREYTAAGERRHGFL
jgi:hypothetical protein